MKFSLCQQDKIMIVKNSVYPNNEQMAGFQAPGDDQPIFMVNLLQYRETAEYEDGRDTQLSGQEAYAIYSAGVQDCIKLVGGEIVFAGTVRRLMLGEVEELWDDIAIAKYPSRKAMLEMMMLPEYAAIADHRSAGLAGQLNIETVSPLA